MFLMEPNCVGYFVCSGKQAFVTINTSNKSLKNCSCCAIMCREYQQKGKAWEHDQSTRLNNHRKTYHGKFYTQHNKIGKPSARWNGVSS